MVLRSAREGVFCAGANIRMLGRASHGHKVNFCKFTNETRMSIEDASANSGPDLAVRGERHRAGGGYELALTAEHIMLVDDRRSGVSLPETPLLAVLPGTGGLTRLTDKRRVRRDLRRSVLHHRGRRARQARRAVAAGGRGGAALGLRGDRARPRRRTRRRAPTGPPERAASCSARWPRVFADDAVTYSHVRVALRPRRAPRRRSPCCGPQRAARRPGRHPRGGRCSSGRCWWRANWTTRCCICA